jgi:hypothetical protein
MTRSRPARRPAPPLRIFAFLELPKPASIEHDRGWKATEAAQKGEAKALDRTVTDQSACRCKDIGAVASLAAITPKPNGGYTENPSNCAVRNWPICGRIVIVAGHTEIT